MRTLSQRLRVIFLPYLLIAVGFILGYSFLNWLLLIKLELFSLEEDVVNFWFPFVLPWIPILVWLRPRIKALCLMEGKGNLPVLFLIGAGLAITVPTSIAQFYLATASGGITTVERIGQIETAPRTKFCTVRDLGLETDHISTETEVEPGIHGDLFRLTAFGVCPATDPGEVGGASHRRVWVGWVTQETLGRRVGSLELERIIDKFLRTAVLAILKTDPKTVTYLERPGYADERRGFAAAVRRNRVFHLGEAFTVLITHTSRIEDRNGSKLAWVFVSFGIGACLWLSLLLAAPLDRKEMDRLLSGQKPDNADLFEALKIFVPSRACFAAPLLIDINILVFAAMVLGGLGFFSFQASDLLALGANYRPAVLDGEVWRLAVCVFLHGGVVHLAANSLGLLYVGLLLEPVLGRIRFVACFLASGLSGSIASVVWYKATVSVGASGGIMGLWGVMIALSFVDRAKVPMHKNPLARAALFLVGYNVLVGLLSGGVDNAAHLGGLGCGILAGMLDGLFPGLLQRGRTCACGKAPR